MSSCQCHRWSDTTRKCRQCAALHLGVSVSYLDHLGDHGPPAVRLAGKVSYYVEDLDAFVRARKGARKPCRSTRDARAHGRSGRRATTPGTTASRSQSTSTAAQLAQQISERLRAKSEKIALESKRNGLRVVSGGGEP